MKKLTALLIVAASLIFFGCNNTYDEMSSLKQEGLSNGYYVFDDTTLEKDTIEDVAYPFWHEVSFYYPIDSNTMEKTTYIMRFVAYGVTDTSIKIRKEIIKTVKE